MTPADVYNAVREFLRTSRSRAGGGSGFAGDSDGRGLGRWRRRCQALRSAGVGSVSVSGIASGSGSGGGGPHSGGVPDTGGWAGGEHLTLQDGLRNGFIEPNWEPIGGAWVESDSLRASGGSLGGPAANQIMERRVWQNFRAGVTLAGTVNFLPNHALLARGSTSGGKYTGWAVIAYSTGLDCQRYDSDVVNLTTSWSGAVAAGDLIELELIGTAVKVYHNGAVVLSPSDFVLVSGRVGVGSANVNARFNDFSAAPA